MSVQEPSVDALAWATALVAPESQPREISGLRFGDESRGCFDTRKRMSCCGFRTTLPRSRRNVRLFSSRRNSVSRCHGFSGVDFAQLRREAQPQQLLVRAERAIADFEPTGPDGFVHGDLWQGNSLWRGDILAGVIDWDCAGTGKAGIDLGSLRFDAVLNFGAGADADVLAGGEAEAGESARDVAYWDVQAGALERL